MVKPPQLLVAHNRAESFIRRDWRTDANIIIVGRLAVSSYPIVSDVVAPFSLSCYIQPYNLIHLIHPGSLHEGSG